MITLLLSFVPAFIFMILLTAYYLQYERRRNILASLVASNPVMKEYYNTKDETSFWRKHFAHFERYNELIGYSGVHIFFAGVLTTITVWIITILAMVKFDIINTNWAVGSSWLECIYDLATKWAKAISSESNNNAPVFFAAFGAYIWGVYDLLVRFRRFNWTPVIQHQIWLRIPIAMLLAYFIQDAFKDTFNNLVAFGIGTFPLDRLQKFLQKYVSSKLTDMQGNEIKLEAPQWEKLQGISPGIIERLTDVDIESTEQLAYSDPLKLYFKTNIDLRVLLDLMDQAILLKYCQDKVPDLRSLGICGSVEMAVHFYRYYSPDIDPQYGERLKSVVPDIIQNIAGVLGKSPDEVKNMMLNLYEDKHVNLIWKFWNKEDSTPENSTSKTSTNTNK